MRDSLNAAIFWQKTMTPETSPVKNGSVQAVPLSRPPFSRGQCVSDTWHISVDEAKQQATYEYEGVALSWEDVPQMVVDVAEYGLARARKH